MTWRWPQLRLRPALWLLGAMLLFGAWSSSTVVLALRGDGSDLPWSRPVLWEMTGALAGYLTLPIALTAALNAPRGRWVRFAGVHLAGFALFSAGKLLLMVGARFLLYPALGWGAYEYGPFALRIPMEAQKDLISYLGCIALLELWRLWRERQQVEVNLREARLHALTGQLGPHFLFNALNTVSAVMYEDLARTDRLLADLGILLRASFEPGSPSWSLAEERAYTERYLRVVEARFGDRVQVQWQLEAETHGAQVPRFALQLLVENALKHNADRTAPLHLRLTAKIEGDRVIAAVEDDGRGFGGEALAPGASPAARGTGLRHLEHSLELLFGERASLVRGESASGGARVTLALPVRR